ncbi:MAG: hypothetical protein RLZZ444_2080 [Pseudomonadota bacterium]|jgi:uncharacterized OB-fold protein
MVDETIPDVGPEARFKTFLEEGRFMIQQSRSTGRYCFYPRLAIPGTGETDLEWVQASGRGTVYAITINRKREGDQNIALIDLDEGVRMMSTIRGVETCSIGTRVKARIEQLASGPAVVFDVEGSAQ